MTAINILLEPDATKLRHSAANNERLPGGLPEGLPPDAAHRPTMIQRFVRTADLVQVSAAAGQPRVQPTGQITSAWCLLASHVLRICCFAGSVTAQEMQPRAYIPAPSGLNFIGASYSYNSGGLLFDPSLPVEDGHVNANIVTLSFGQSLGVAGRTAQVLAVVPYAVANLDGRLGAGDTQYLYRSGLGDTVFRYAMNIHGAPAMKLKEFAKYRQKTIVGASITVSAPTGQNDPNKLINIGANRWALKPELGVSRAIGHWTLEGAFGVWLYTANNQFYGGRVRTQDPLASLQGHLVRVLPHRTWLALDATYFAGALSQVDGHVNDDRQSNVRFGANFGIPLNRRQAIRFSFFSGAVTRVGADIRSIGISYIFIWQKGRL